MEKQFLLPANILLPKKDAHLWSVIACDQYTSEPEYWEKVKETVGCAPSALNIILPEAYLSDDDSEKIKKINQTMNDYLSDNVFKTIENSIIYTQRTLKNGKVRKGLVGLIDLEDYSYKKGAKTATRATEETVLERIPPRVEIRKDAVLEIPHIMMLIDDPQNTVFGCVEATGALEKVYDFTLMQNAGSIIGYSLPSDYITNVQNALLELSKNLEVSYMKRFIGKKLEFIPEIEKEGYLYGHTGNYLYVKVKGCKELLHNSLMVVIENIDYPYCNGNIEEKEKYYEY